MKTEGLKLYIDELNKQYKTGIAREHSYRPALKDVKHYASFTCCGRQKESWERLTL